MDINHYNFVSNLSSPCCYSFLILSTISDTDYVLYQEKKDGS